MAFTYTVSKLVYNEDNLIPGTAVHYQSGTVADGTFKEGNGIVVMCTPLNLEIDLYNVHTYLFERVSIPVDQFTSGSVLLQVLTIEDGVGTEPTGAIPTDIYPPADVTMLRAEYIDTTATLYWSNPTTDFDHIKVFRDGALLDDTIMVEVFTDNTLTPGVSYTYEIVTVDAVGNESVGKSVTFTTNTAGDSTVNLATAI